MTTPRLRIATRGSPLARWQAEHVADLLRAFEAPATTPASAPEPPLEVPSLARVEWEHINRVLAECGGNISKAARLLGLQRRSLQRKLAKYPVRR